ncbi:MAG: pilin N-terminal domain-containing protein [Peptoniphilaceae bacterium]|nr:pilin N-terminal domain-containing protein [Peptoniphilaceae bacterium]MDY6085831.1 pilin N-terminal domain-containing protein [Peptoniphilaceae bacterium]
MKRFKKYLSLLLALVLVIGAVAPVSAQEAGYEGTIITIHKILMDPEQMAAHTDANQDPKYTGSKIDSITDYFGQSAQEIAGVAFDVYMEVDETPGDPETTDLKRYDDPILGGLGIPGKDYQKVNENSYITAANDDNTISVDTEPLGEGTYIIVENKANSTYVGADGAALTDSKAIPTKITLPMDYDNAGNKFDIYDHKLHIYPKNTESAPKIDKNFQKDHGLQIDADEGKNHNLGADYKNYTADKATATALIGTSVPYEVKTEIPAKSDYKTVRWEDTMTHGLTFDKNLVIKLNGETFDAANYDLVQNASGFTLTLNDVGLAALKAAVANDAAEFLLTYSATINESAVVDVPDENRVVFNYGNAPQDFNEPRENSTTPSKKEITVTKTWAEGTEPPTSLDVTYYLYERGANPEDDKVVATQKANTRFGAKFTDLDDAKTYYVKEVVQGYTPEYTSAENGAITVTNAKNTYPTPLEPTHPDVVTHGKKFVKADATSGVRLAGAEFIVAQDVTTTEEGDTSTTVTKYLKLKGSQDETALDNAKDAYINAVNAYNEAAAKTGDFKVTIGEAEYTDKTEAQKAIDALKTAYFNAAEALNSEWELVDNAEEAYTFVADQYGRFEVTGLATGSYKLIETKAPKGYAKANDPFTFEVGQGSYDTVYGGVWYYDDRPVFNGEKGSDAQRIDNKTITIPMTGGMGTILFTVVGLAIMAGAIVLMKRNQKEEAL